jgi:hypothetical protein
MEHFTRVARAKLLAAIGISGTQIFVSTFALCAFMATADNGWAAKAKPQTPAAPASEADAKQKAGEAARQSYDAGIKSYASGKHQLAVDQLSSALRAGGLGSGEMAKALYVRGSAYKRLDKPGLAISDLTSALWLKNGLGEADQKAAIAERAEAYRMAGLGDGTAGTEHVSVANPNPTPAGSKAVAQVVAAIAPPVAPEAGGAVKPAAVAQPASAPVAMAAASSQVTRQSPESEAARDAANARRIAAQPVESNGIQAAAAGSMIGTTQQASAAPQPTSLASSFSTQGTPATAQAQSAPVLSAAPIESASQPVTPVTSAGNVTSAIGGFFSNLFSGGATSTPAPDVASSVTTASTTPPVATSSWSDSTSVATGSAQPAKVNRPVQVSAAPAVAAAPAIKSGKYKLHIAAVRSRAEAEALAQKLSAEQAPALQSRVPVVDEAVIGSMGKFYRVRVGSFQTPEEPRGVCNTLRSSGFDCLVVTN